MLGAMADDVEELDAIAIALVKVAVDHVPQIQKLGESARPDAVRALWPAPPRVVTWKEVRAGFVAWVRETSDEEVARELAEGPRQGGSSLSPRTAQRIAKLEMNAGALDAFVAYSYLDELLFPDGMPERLRLGELIEQTVGLLLGLARMAFDSPYPALRAGRALVLARALLDYLEDMQRVFARIDWNEAADILAGIVREVQPFYERLDAAEQQLLDEVRERGVPPEPELAETESAGPDESEPTVERVVEISPAESLRQLAFLAAESRRVAPIVADIVMREIYPDGAPRTVSLVDVHDAMDARLGTETPRSTLDSIAECDELVCPEDPDAPFSVHELFDAVATVIEGAHERITAEDEATRQEYAFPVLLRGRLLALHLAGAAQMTGHPTVVAGLAAALGLDPVLGARPVGSA